ncbi:ABC transporter permease [Anoxybacteroides amylolyticum]|uniref:Transport permease protein n=1 Tax=Anoxybacteroides amylolyticum TaxID=294699 RepID=A0A160F5J8_9BACL|nr:ABC transporter permease [Anoxybacillus amylolyticus]ANB61135.1 ABC-2 type transporter family protein [Anoxybacillus amylolyticus]
MRLLGDIRSLFLHRSLIMQFIKREVRSRYQGSYLGIVWSFITPLMMLMIYTFVFSVVFKARWGTSSGNSKVEFALLLFSGLIVFNIFSEVVSRAPMLITSNVNYVKKVVFPLEILPIVILGSSLFHLGINIVILIMAILIFTGKIYWTVILLPLVLLPICLFTLGLGWFLSSLGVYIRDIGQVMSVVISALMFLSPIFYPISAIPKELQFLYYINPISYVVEDVRRITVWGLLPHWNWLIIGTVFGVITALLGLIWFKKTRGGFADVL